MHINKIQKSRKMETENGRGEARSLFMRMYFRRRKSRWERDKKWCLLAEIRSSESAHQVRANWELALMGIKATQRIRLTSCFIKSVGLASQAQYSQCTSIQRDRMNEWVSASSAHPDKRENRERLMLAFQRK